MAYSVEIKPHSFKTVKLSIDEDKITLGDKSIATQEITGMAYGATSNSTNGVKTHSNYSFKFGDDNGNELKLFFMGGAVGTTKGADDTYQEIINEVWRHVGERLYKKLRTSLLEGKPYPIGKAKLLPEGIAFERKPLFGARKAYTIKWHDLQTEFVNGNIVLSSSAEKKAKISLAPDTTFNVRVLYAFIEATREDGAILGEIYRKHGLSV